MSIETTVILAESNLPSPQTWQAFIDKHNIALCIDTTFTWYSHSGWLPCQYQGEETGFELYSERFTPEQLLTEEYVTEEESKMLGNRSYLVTFVTHFKILDSLSVHLASASLTQLSDGFMLEDSEPPFLSASEVFGKIKHVEEEFLILLNDKK